MGRRVKTSSLLETAFGYPPEGGNNVTDGILLNSGRVSRLTFGINLDKTATKTLTGDMPAVYTYLSENRLEKYLGKTLDDLIFTKDEVRNLLNINWKNFIESTLPPIEVEAGVRKEKNFFVQKLEEHLKKVGEEIYGGKSKNGKNMNEETNEKINKEIVKSYVKYMAMVGKIIAYEIPRIAIMIDTLYLLKKAIKNGSIDLKGKYSLREIKKMAGIDEYIRKVLEEYKESILHDPTLKRIWLGNRLSYRSDESRLKSKINSLVNNILYKVLNRLKEENNMKNKSKKKRVYYNYMIIESSIENYLRSLEKKLLSLTDPKTFGKLVYTGGTEGNVRFGKIYDLDGNMTEEFLDSDLDKFFKNYSWAKLLSIANYADGINFLGRVFKPRIFKELNDPDKKDEMQKWEKYTAVIQNIVNEIMPYVSSGTKFPPVVISSNP